MRDDLLTPTATATVAPRPPEHFVQTWYPALTEQANRVRLELTGLLSAWGLPDLADDAQLVITELFANAVRHTPGPPEYPRLRVETAVVRAEEDDTVLLRIGVTDTDPRTISRVRPPRNAEDFDGLDDAPEGGMGLRLVEAYALRWGVAPCSTGAETWGKTVWADLAIA